MLCIGPHGRRVLFHGPHVSAAGAIAVGNCARPLDYARGGRHVGGRCACNGGGQRCAGPVVIEGQPAVTQVGNALHRGEPFWKARGGDGWQLLVLLLVLLQELVALDWREAVPGTGCLAA
eukprot:1160045-Pelagomonas_calceolata.AAC.11